MAAELIKQGAEARVYSGEFFAKPCLVKERFSKKYRHATLDKSLTQQRTKSEVRCMMRCRMNGIHTPAVYLVDHDSSKIYMEYIAGGVTVKEYIAGFQREHLARGSTDYAKEPKLQELSRLIGRTLGIMHEKNIIHGDLTTSNLMLRDTPEQLQLVLIDFGLGYVESLAEDKGVDLYVLERAIVSTHPNSEALFETILQAYQKSYGGQKSEEVIRKFEEVRLRGRKRTMVG